MSGIEVQPYKRVLVTGGLGFLGSNLVRALLARGLPVTVLDNAFRGAVENLSDVIDRVTLIEGDVRDPAVVLKAARGADAIVHLAAIQGTGNFYRMPVEVLDVNVKGVMAALEACVAVGARRFFFASSSEAYGEAVTYPTGEDAPLMVPDPRNPRYTYGGSKIIGELFTINYARQYGFDYTVVRYHNVYGPAMGSDHVIPQFILQLARNQEFTVQGDGQQTRAFCYIDDAIDASLRALLLEPGCNQIFNIGNDERECTINEVIHLLSRLTGRTIVPRHVPFADEGTRRRIPDIRRARTLLGYQPTITLEDGLARTYEWYAEDVKRKPVGELR